MSESKYACTEGADCCCKHVTHVNDADVAQPGEQVAGAPLTVAVGCEKCAYLKAHVEFFESLLNAAETDLIRVRQLAREIKRR